MPLSSPSPKTRSSWPFVSIVFTASILLRALLLIYGLYQDAHSSLKYTDIDYLVFTDASRFLSLGRSPYTRATYRYTPLLAWLMLPTTWPGRYWFSFGKALFALSDVVAGWLILKILRRRGLEERRALGYSCAWLLNPMVANISTRGSSEGLLCVMVMALLWATEMQSIGLAGVLLGFSVHFKIYPFIYGVSILWALESKDTMTSKSSTLYQSLASFLNRNRLIFLLTSLSTFSILNISMYIIYGVPFVQHTFLHHVTRIDHRHNFSPYNTLLYLSSSSSSSSTSSTPAAYPTFPSRPPTFHFESLAFIPQIALSTFLIPLVLAKKDLASTMLAQTFAFVTFNKVCTSQYFLWYLIFLPIYLPDSSFIQQQGFGMSALGLWVAAQALWLQQGYQLEFLGKSAFVPGLWAAGLVFFVVNVWVLGIIIEDVGRRKEDRKVLELGARLGEGREEEGEVQSIPREKKPRGKTQEHRGSRRHIDTPKEVDVSS